MLCALEIEDGSSRWIPVSQVHEDSEVWLKGHEGNLVVTRWFAGQIGF